MTFNTDNIPSATSEDRRLFAAYMDKVNAHLLDRVGLEADDLPDYDYWSTWEAGIPATQAAEEAIRHAADF